MSRYLSSISSILGACLLLLLFSRSAPAQAGIDPEVEKQIQNLAARDPGVRKASVEALLKVLDNKPRPESRIQARIFKALGNLGDDQILPDLLAQLTRPLDGHAQVALGVALCKLGARAGVDLLLNVAFRPSGSEVLEAIQGLKTCVDEDLPVPSQVVPDRSAVYGLQLRWNRVCVALPLRVGPASPSPGLRARIESLVARIGKEASPTERQETFMILVALRDRAAKELIRAFTRYPAAEEEIVRILVKMGPYAMTSLVEALEATDLRKVRGAVRALGDMPVQSRTFPCLSLLLARSETAVLGLLKRVQGDLRVAVLDLVGWVGAEASRVPLSAVLLDPKGEGAAARLAAARSLGLIGAEKGREALWTVAGDPGQALGLRCQAAFSCALLGDKRGTGKLVALLEEGSIPIPYLRRLSGWVYFGHEVDPGGAIRRWQTWWKNYAAVIRVNPRQVKMELLWQRENRVFRRELMEDWLAGLGSDRKWIDRVDQEARILPMFVRMIPTLEEVARTSGDAWIRFHAVQMMATCGERAAVPALVHALKDPVARVRATAAEGLGFIGRDFEYEDYSLGLKAGLNPLLQDSDPYVRIQVALALARLRYADGIPVLLRALEHADAAVVDLAWITLRKVTGGKDFDFNPHGPLHQRQAALKQLHAWWEQQGKTFRPLLPASR